MIRRFGWVLLVGAGVLLGGTLNPYQNTDAAPPPPAGASSEEETKGRAESVHQLKEINAQLKEINVLLRTGTVKVIVVLNPDPK
jgi:hypothetical protein